MDSFVLFINCIIMQFVQSRTNQIMESLLNGSKTSLIFSFRVVKLSWQFHHCIAAPRHTQNLLSDLVAISWGWSCGQPIKHGFWHSYFLQFCFHSLSYVQSSFITTIHLVTKVSATLKKVTYDLSLCLSPLQHSQGHVIVFWALWQLAYI